MSAPGCRTAPCDLVFILDGSWSVEDLNFEIVKGWLVNITSSFNIGQKFTQVGVVQYSDDPVLEIPLGKYSSTKDLIKAMENIEYMGGNTRTGTAIQFATDRLFGFSERSPQGISRIAVVLTDGKSQDGVVKAAEIARKKRSNSVCNRCRVRDGRGRVEGHCKQTVFNLCLFCGGLQSYFQDHPGHTTEAVWG